MRKKLLYTTLLISSTFAFTSIGCGKGYFELYDNPSNAATATLPTLLTTVTHKAGINTYNFGSTLSYYPQYLASPSASSPTDIYEEIDMSGTWDALYYALADTKDLLELAEAGGSTTYKGVANFLIAYNLSLGNDVWGKMPWTEVSIIGNLKPKYDEDKAIYDTTLHYVNQAIANFESTETNQTSYTVKNDLIYGNDTRNEAAIRQLWLKASYSLKARLLNKASKTPQYDPVAVLAAVDKGFKSNADDMGMAKFQLRNNWASVANSNALLTLGGWLGERFVNHFLDNLGNVVDPRIEKITDKTVDNRYIGTQNGAGNRPPGNNTVKDENYISRNSPLTGDNAPIQLITFAELKFIEAEAALDVDINRAYDAYIDGIKAHFALLGLDPTDYLDLPHVSVGAANLTINDIMREKYVVMYLNPAAWTDARRFDYGYDNFNLPLNALLPDFIRRQQYPRNEQAENGENVPKGVTLLDRLWWDL